MRIEGRTILCWAGDEGLLDQKLRLAVTQLGGVECCGRRVVASPGRQPMQHVRCLLKPVGEHGRARPGTPRLAFVWSSTAELGRFPGVGHPERRLEAKGNGPAFDQIVHQLRAELVDVASLRGRSVEWASPPSGPCGAANVQSGDDDHDRERYGQNDSE